MDHPEDPGGATNWGVSIRALRQLEGDDLLQYDYDGDGDVDADDMRLMSRADAVAFYEEHFWHPWMDETAMPLVAAKGFDMGVNMGPRQAGKLLQKAINFLNSERISEDGIVGPNTLMAMDRLQRAGKGMRLLDEVVHQQAAFYFRLCDRKPSRSVFLLGWLRRAYWTP